jgi:hypothetical protein
MRVEVQLLQLCTTGGMTCTGGKIMFAGSLMSVKTFGPSPGGDEKRLPAYVRQGDGWLLRWPRKLLSYHADARRRGKAGSSESEAALMFRLRTYGYRCSRRLSSLCCKRATWMTAVTSAGRTTSLRDSVARVAQADNKASLHWQGCRWPGGGRRGLGRIVVHIGMAAHPVA